MTDPIADMLTRLRNASAARKPVVTMPGSRVKKSILDIFVARGYIASVTEAKDGSRKTLTATLIPGRALHLTRASRPGQRRYLGAADLMPVQRGEGLAIVSTSSGIMTHIDAKKANIGGELICEIF